MCHSAGWTGTDPATCDGRGWKSFKLISNDDDGHWNHWASAVLGETRGRPQWVRILGLAHAVGPLDPKLRVGFFTWCLPAQTPLHPGPDSACTVTLAPGVRTEPGRTVGILFWASGLLGGQRGPCNHSGKCFSSAQHSWSSTWMSDLTGFKFRFCCALTWS